jgi:hypothetical protein
MILIIILLFLIIIFLLILNNKNERFDSNINLVKKIKNTVEIINENNFSNYKNELDNLYKNCVFDDNIYSDFTLNNSKSILFILKHNNKIIGSLQIDDFDNLNKMFYINFVGALKDKKGLYLTFLCGNKDYKGITEPLFYAVNNYAKENGFEYILLEARGEWRQKYYKKFGFNNINFNQTSMIKYI